MAIQTATFTFSLPEDMNADQIRILSALAENGSYAIEYTADYEYGTTKLEYNSLNDTYWYKIQFYNSVTLKAGVESEPVAGSTFSAAAPFVAISTTWDGANYATTQDVYDYSDLTTDDISSAKVSKALKRARAEIDLRTSEMSIDRFDSFDNDTARRKYNASLQILKEAEICLALYQMYTNLSDNLIIKNMRTGEGSIAGSISIGDTSISGDSLAERSENIIYLATLADRYYLMAERKLSSLDQNSISLISTDYRAAFPRSRFPGRYYYGT